MPASKERVELKEPLSRIIDRWALRYGLSEAEKEILDVACTATSNVQGLADYRGTTYCTVKKQVQHILRKTGDKRLSLAALRLLKEAYALARLEASVGVDLTGVVPQILSKEVS